MQHGRSRLEEASLILNDELLEDIEKDNIDCTESSRPDWFCKKMFLEICI